MNRKDNKIKELEERIKKLELEKYVVVPKQSPQEQWWENSPCANCSVRLSPFWNGICYCTLGTKVWY